jgi:predicted acyltransferase
VGYEILEQMVEGRGGKVPESAMNVLGDLVWGMAGYAAARYTKDKPIFE